jgi:hypothetical protein
MTASTIVEVFVEADGIRVAAEVGVADLKAFRNVLPDELYEKLGHERRSLAERLRAFCREDWVIRAEGGEPLIGRIERIVPRRRIIRDEITGEPLPVQPKDAPVVVFVELTYPLAGRPKALSLRPPAVAGRRFAAASIGFVVYHLGVAVNDFRYLGGEETLDLDWDDAWYSRFRNRNLWRRYAAPIQGFLYVDNFEVRKEIIARPKDLQQWTDLGLGGKQVIPVGEQEALKEKVAAFLAGRHPVTVDGKPVEMTLDRIHFIRRTLRRTGVIDPPEDLPVVSATLGVIFVQPTNGLPKQATMRWDLFNDQIRKVPMVATDEAGGLPSYATEDDPVLRWQNFLKNPRSTSLVDIAPPPGATKLTVPVGSAVCAVGLLAALVRLAWPKAGGRKRAAALAGILALAVTALWPFMRVSFISPLSGPARVSDTDAKAIVSGLLKNVYRAFDYRGESAIYDTLARSAAGDQLARIYLETQRALELRNQGGARAKVQEVKLLDAKTTNFGEEVGFSSRCKWNVVGSVGHWGHIHQRRNQYEAEFTVKPVEGEWKITHLEVLNEQRL